MKKLISVFMVICISITGLPMMAFAANITPEVSFEDFMSQMQELIDQYDTEYVSEMVFENGSDLYTMNGEEHPVETESGTSVAAEIHDGTIRIPTNIIEDMAVEVTDEESNVSLFSANEELDTQELAEQLGYEVEITDETAIFYQPYQTHRIIVKSKFNIDELDSVAIVEGYNDLHIVQFDNIVSTLEALEYYEDQMFVEYAEPDIVLSTCAEVSPTSNKNLSITMPYGNHLSWGSEDIGYDDYVDYINDVDTLPEIVVGVIDTGIDIDHEFFGDRVIRTRFNKSTSGSSTSEDDDNGHGSHVAGIIADNTTDNVKIRGYKILSNKGSGAVSVISLAIERAVADGVNVINMSLGAPGSSLTIEQTIRNAIESGIIVCVAAGNNGDNATKYTPARIPECITVAAYGKNDTRPSWTNYGSVVDITAPGVSIYSSYMNNKYQTLSGTSMATPFVAAASAMILSKNPNLQSDDLLAMLLEKSRPCKESYYDHLLFGVNALFIGKMIVENQDRTQTPILSSPGGKYYDSITLELSCPDEENAQIYYTLDGTRATMAFGTPYTEPIEITETTTVHAFAIVNGKLKSLQVSAEYYIVTMDSASNFEIDSRGYITAYNGNNSYLIVPRQINHITVTGIANGAFTQSAVKSSLTVLELPDTLINVDDYAFADCMNLISFNCSNLKNVGMYAFKNCVSLKDIDLSHLENVGRFGFYCCNNISELRSTGLTIVSSYAFHNLTNIVGIDLPNVTSVLEEGFSNSERLEAVNLPNCKYLGQSAFKNCTSLKSIYLPLLKNLDTTTGRQFYDCTNLTQVNMPLLTKVAPNMFYGTKIEKIFLPEVTTLLSFSFNNVGSLRILYAPKLDTIEGSAFARTSNLETVFVPNLRVLNSYLINRTATIYLTDKLTSAIENSSYHYNIIAPDDTYAANWAKKCNYNFIDSCSVADALGGTIRLSDKGLRFGFSWTDIEEFEEFSPRKIFGLEFDVGEVDTLNNFMLAGRKTYSEETKTTTFNLVITNIPREELSTYLSARAYVEIDGMVFKSPILSRSFASVATSVLADENIDEQTKDELRALLD